MINSANNIAVRVYGFETLTVPAVEEYADGEIREQINIQLYGAIEQYVMAYEDTKTIYASGNIYIMGGAICIASNNTIFFYDSGMEYTVASNHLNYNTLIMMGESLRDSNEK